MIRRNHKMVFRTVSVKRSERLGCSGLLSPTLQIDVHNLEIALDFSSKPIVGLREIVVSKSVLQQMGFDNPDRIFFRNPQPHFEVGSDPEIRSTVRTDLLIHRAPNHARGPTEKYILIGK